MTPLMTRYASAAALLAAAALAACDKTAVQTIDSPEIPSSAVRFFNFGVGAPALNFYANTTKMTAINSSSCSPTPTDTMLQRICRDTGSESTSGVTYGNVGSGGLYSGLAPGDYTLKGTIAAATDKDLAIASLPVTIAADKLYSFYVSGPYDGTAKTADAFIVEDPLPAIDWDNAIVRFVNASSNSSPMTLTTRDSTTKTETAIGADVAYKGAGTFTTIPGGLYELYTTVAGSATKVIKRTGVSFSAGHIYTISARGDITVSSGSAAKALDNTANR